jgi:hypothetical protein
LPFRQCAHPQVFSAFKEEIECKINQMFRLSLRQSSLKRHKIRSAVGIEGGDLSIDDPIGQPGGGVGIAANFLVQSRPLRVFSVAFPFSTRS